MQFDLNIATYNIYMRPEYLFIDGQKRRLSRLVPKIKNLDADILVINEAFDNSIRKTLCGRLKSHFPHQTDVVGQDRGISQDGGVVLLSKHTILKQAQITFKIAEGSDRWGDKGCIYAKVQTPVGICHVFGTHLDAGRGGTTVRRSQLRMIRDFIDSRVLDTGEPVFVAGDLNMGPRQRPAEFTRMLEILGAAVPKRTGHSHSYDPKSNKLAGKGAKRHLDHILYLRHHKMPTNSENEVVPLKAAKPWSDIKHRESRDLSDHYPVLGWFELS